MKRLIITIDGPAGSGKTTVSKVLASRLNYRYVDTGALYRGIALESMLSGVSFKDAPALQNMLAKIDLKLVMGKSKEPHLLLDGKDISDKIRTPHIAMIASKLSAQPAVRESLLQVQRDLAKGKGVVFEGRDMGTVVFPNADIKFFLTASIEERASRRYNEFSDETIQTLEEIERDMQIRDENDTEREIAPLKPADDAVILDSTKLTIKDVINKMLDHIRETNLIDI